MIDKLTINITRACLFLLVFSSTLAFSQVEVLETYVGNDISESIDGTGLKASFGGLYDPQINYNTNTVHFLEGYSNTGYHFRKITSDTIVTTLPFIDSTINITAYAVNSKEEIHYFHKAQIFKIEPNGTSTHISGGENYNSFVDGPKNTATFGHVYDAVFDSDDNLYFTAGSTIKKMDQNGYITTIAGSHNESGTDDNNNGQNATFQYQGDLSIDNNDNLYIYNRGDYFIKNGYSHQTHFVRKVSTNYPYSVSTIIGNAYKTNPESVIFDGTGSTFSFSYASDNVRYDAHLNKLILIGRNGYCTCDLNSPYTIEQFDFNSNGYGKRGEGPYDWDYTYINYSYLQDIYWNSNNEQCFLESNKIKRISTINTPNLYFSYEKIITTKCFNREYADLHRDHTRASDIVVYGINLTDDVTISISNGFQFKTNGDWQTNTETVSINLAEQSLSISYKPTSHELGTKTGTITFQSNDFTEVFELEWIVNEHPPVPIAFGSERCDSGDVTLATSIPIGADYVQWYYSENDRSIRNGDTITIALDTTTSVYAISSINGCYSIGGDTVLAIIKHTPELQSTTTDIVCDNGIAHLESEYDIGTIRWWPQETGGTKINNGKVMEQNISTTTSFYVDAQNLDCIAPRTEVIATVSTTHSISSVNHNSICEAGALTLSATSTGGTIRWFADSLSTSILQTGNNYSPTITQADTFWVDSENNTCISSNKSPVYASIVNILKADSLNGPLDVCEGQTVTYSANKVNGAENYNWIVPKDASIESGQGTQTVSITFGATEGFIGVSPVGSCSNNSDTLEKYIRVYQAPGNTPNITGPTTLCSKQTGVHYEIENVVNAEEYIWTTPDTSFITSATNTNAIDINFNYSTSRTENISVTPNGNCGTGTTVTLPITLNLLSIETPTLDTAFIESDYEKTITSSGFSNAIWEFQSTLNSLTFTNEKLMSTPTVEEEGTHSVTLTATEENIPSCFTKKTYLLPTVFKKSNWNGTSWTNGEPDEFTDVTIFGNYKTATNNEFTTHNLTIASNDTLSISTYDHIVIHNNLTTLGTGAVTTTCLSSITVNGIQNGNIILLSPEIQPENNLLPGAFKDSLYQFDFSINNLPSPTWSLLNSSLPNGMSLVNSTLIGTPTENGEYTFSIHAQQDVCSDTKEFTLRIGDLQPSNLLISNESKTYGDSSFFVSVASTNTAPIKYSLIPNDGCATIDSTTGLVSLLCGTTGSIQIVASQESDGIHYASTATAKLTIKKASTLINVEQAFFDLEDKYGTLVFNEVNFNSHVKTEQLSGYSVAQIYDTNNVSLLDGGLFEIRFYVDETDKFYGSADTLLFQVNKPESPELKATELITPNSDGKNEAFEIRNTESGVSNELIILTRNGNIIYRKNNYRNNWKGTDYEDGIYYFIFTEGERELKGQFELRR